MKIEFSKIKNHEKIEFLGDLKYFNNQKNISTIKEYKEVKANISLERANDITIIKYDIDAKLKVYSTLSGEEFDYPLHVVETLYYTENKELESEDVFFINEGYVNLEDEIYSLIITSIPLILHKKGEKYPKGENYRVISEDELNEDDGSGFSPFDKLKDLDL